MAKPHSVPELTERELLRFDSFVDKPEQWSSCWIWKGSKIGGGYGWMKIRGINYPAHRISWTIHYGQIPDGLFVLHNCPGGDNPACVNPDHLWLGTALDNNRDARDKGRYANRQTEEHKDKLRISAKLASKAHSEKCRSMKYCPNGHEYTPDNSYFYKGRRQCRKCRNNAAMRLRQRWRTLRVP